MAHIPPLFQPIDPPDPRLAQIHVATFLDQVLGFLDRIAAAHPSGTAYDMTARCDHLRGVVGDMRNLSDPTLLDFYLGEIILPQLWEIHRLHHARDPKR